MSEQEKSREEIEQEQRDNQQKQVQRIIRGVNDIWSKTYKYEDMELEFTIKLRAPSMLDRGRIEARKTRYLDGMASWVGDYYTRIFWTLAIIREVGVEVPEFLKDDDNIFNEEILLEIGTDFQQWLGQFRY